MKLKIFAFAALLILSCLLLCACRSGLSTAHIMEVSKYEEKTADISPPVKLYVECDDGDMDVYCWTLHKLGVEVTEKLKGYETEEQLMKSFGEFNFKLEDAGGILRLETGFKGRSDLVHHAEIRLYLPKNPDKLDIVVNKGKLRFLDDLECGLTVKGDRLELEMNSFKGKLVSEIGTGSLTISEGMLESGSGVRLTCGNIKIRTGLQVPGKYSFKTERGIVDTCFPENLKAVFLTASGMDDGKDRKSEEAAEIQLESGSGDVRISGYQT